jgi:transposase
VARRILAHIDFLDDSIASLNDEISERLRPLEAAITLLCTIPGVSRLTAEVIVAETGADMARFPTPEQLAAWAGVAPANHESAGKRRPAGTRQGGRWLRNALIEAAKSAGRTKDTYLAAKYRTVARRRGPNKATVAVAHAITVAIWHMLTTGQPYHDLGGDLFEKRRDPEHEAKRLVRKLADLGFNATLEPAA